MQLGGVAANKVAAAERIVNAGRAPAMFEELRGRLRMGLVNIGRDEVLALGVEGDAVRVDFERVSETFRWSDLFPEWIDEEEDDEGPSCPELPMPDWSRYADGGGDVDVVVASVPCNRSAPGWNRDVFRLQVHLVAAHVAARKGRRDGGGAVRVVLRSQCEPMMDLFRCDEAVGREGDWYMYRVDVQRLEEKLRLPVGSCNLAMPLWGAGGTFPSTTSSCMLSLHDLCFMLTLAQLHCMQFKASMCRCTCTVLTDNAWHSSSTCTSKIDTMRES
jgi:hypothetical protein